MRGYRVTEHQSVRDHFTWRSLQAILPFLWEYRGRALLALVFLANLLQLRILLFGDFQLLVDYWIGQRIRPCHLGEDPRQPLLLRFVGRISPWRWFQAMSPPLLTAFSTSSSSLTLPVTLEAVEHRGKVSNKTTSFVLPLGATINMDGTALYECVGVIFLAR